MGLDATALLGDEQLAGVRVNSRGFYLAQLSHARGPVGGTFAGGAATAAGGVIGSALLTTWAAKKARSEAAVTPASSAPGFGQMAFLAVTERDLALVNVDARTIAKLTSVLARVARSEVASVVLSSAAPLTSKPLTVTLANGDRWMLEVSAVLRRNARRVVQTLREGRT